jgi:hypothetical protein
MLPAAEGLTQHFQSSVGTFSLHAWILHWHFQNCDGASVLEITVLHTDIVS